MANIAYMMINLEPVSRIALHRRSQSQLILIFLYSIITIMRLPEITTKTCGCSKTIYKHANNQLTYIYYTQCTKHQLEENRRQYIKKLKDLTFHVENAEPLHCGNCNTQIGWIYEGDIEGSYFYCDNCKKLKTINFPNLPLN